VATKNIVMDVTPAGAETGIGRYTRGLATALAETCLPSFRLTLISRRESSLSVFPNAHLISASRLTYQVLGASLLKPFKPSLYLGPDFTYPNAIRVPTVVVAHDLIPWKHPQWISHRARILYRLFGTPCLQKATAVLADSAFTAGEFRQVFRREAHIVYPGIFKLFAPDASMKPSDVIKLPGGREIPEPYLLFVGAFDARRCAPLLLQAFQKIRRTARHPSLSLLLVGKLRGNKVRAAVRELESQGVHFFGGVPDASLVTLYRRASALVYLSAYEGFGYPPVESLACETPVLVTDIPVFRETLGDFASFVPLCDDPDEVARHIFNLLENPPHREVLSRASDFVRQKFSWERSAVLVWDLIRRVLGDA